MNQPHPQVDKAPRRRDGRSADIRPSSESSRRPGLSSPRMAGGAWPSASPWVLSFILLLSFSLPAAAADTAARNTPALAEQRESGDTSGSGDLRIEASDSLEALDDFGTSDWDSIMAAYDEAFEEERRERIAPEYSIRYSKAEGMHVDLGASLAWPPARLARAEARTGYDFKRKKATGLGSLDFALGGGGTWILRLQGHDEIRSFGNHDPYANTLLALFGGYDARQYLHSREGGASLRWRPEEGREYAIGWVRTRQDPVKPVSPFHLFGDDFWMRRNTAAERILANGILLQALRRPQFLGDSDLFGLGYTMDARAYGGELLGGSREFGRGHLDVRFSGRVGRTDTWLTQISGTIATGRAPRQAWPDLGGAAGLRGFPPRGEGTALSLVGRERFLALLEYHWQQDLLRKSRVPVVRHLHLIPVPFIETGAVWSPRGISVTGGFLDDGSSGVDGSAAGRPILEAGDLRAPGRQDFHWDLGIGMRRILDYSGILSHIQLDVAWPMGSDTGPPRFTARFTRSDFD